MSRGKTEEKKAVNDPLQAGGVKVVLEANKPSRWTASIVVKRAIGKADVGRRRPIRIKSN